MEPKEPAQRKNLDKVPNWWGKKNIYKETEGNDRNEKQVTKEEEISLFSK